MPDYSTMMGNTGGQRDAIVRALMGIANPPPPTQMPQAPQMPGQYGPGAGAGAGMGLGNQDPMAAQTPVQAPPVPGPSGQGMPGAMSGGVPMTPPQRMPVPPGGGLAGLPQGPVPRTPGIVGQPLPVQQPGTQINPALPGSQVGGY